MKVLICLPAFGYQCSSETTKCLVALTNEMAKRGIFGGFASHSFPDIVDLRNVMLSVWYDAIDATHMLFVDADMVFEPQLVGDMLLADVPLVGALYRKKRPELMWVGSPLDPPKMPTADGLLELEAIGCGAMLIRRDCVTSMIESGQAKIQDDIRGTGLKDLLEPYGVKRIIHAFDKIVTDTGRHLSEDYSFCWRHRESGGKVWAVITHSIAHLGIYPFAGRYSDMYLQKQYDEAAE